MTYDELDSALKYSNAFESASRKTFDPSLPDCCGSRNFQENSKRFVSRFPEDADGIFMRRHTRYIKYCYHTHEFYEFMFMYEGGCENLTDTSRTRISEGGICLIPPGVWHLPYVTDDSILVNFCVEKSFMSEAAQNYPNSPITRLVNDPACPKYLDIHSEDEAHVRDAALKLIMSFYDEEWEGSRHERRLAFETFLMTLAKYCDTKITASKDHVSADDLSSKLFHVIEAEWRDITLDDLCERFNYSKSYICHVIRQRSGTTFSDIVNEMKISESCFRLRTTTLPISEIALTSGFASIEYFNRVFRQRVGSSPSEYRMSVMNDEGTGRS